MKAIKILLLTSAAFFLMGCGSTKVVFVDTQAQIVRIGPDVSGKVYVLKDGEWVLSKNKMTLPEGWYAGAHVQQSQEEKFFIILLFRLNLIFKNDILK